MKYLFFFPAILLSSLTSLYHSIDPKDISKQLSFYFLYPETKEGKKALKRAASLMGCQSYDLDFFPKLQIQWFVNLLSSNATPKIPLFDKKTLLFFEEVTKDFPHKQLQGHHITKEEEIFSLPEEEIDVARALFICQGLSLQKIISYENYLDLIALQIKARLPKEASNLDKVETINRVLFYDMHFRYPHEADFEKKADTYTILPDVMLSKRGICLGTCLLYMSLAQRLDLSLEILTPPGHIFLRLPSQQEGSKHYNIETTARGVHLPDEQYHQLDLISVPKHDIKEMIGYSFINEAATAFNEERYQDAYQLYERAEKYLPKDQIRRQFQAFCLYLMGKEKKAKQMIKTLFKEQDPYSIRPKTLLEDILSNKLSAKTLAILLKDREDTRAEILKKQQELSDLLTSSKRPPSLLFHLAISYLELWRTKEAEPLLTEYLQHVPDDPIALYYLSEISLDRLNYQQAYHSFTALKKLLKKHHLSLKPLQNLEYTLRLSATKQFLRDKNSKVNPVDN